MKKITNWIKKTKTQLRWFFVRKLTTWAFKLAVKSKDWNQLNYDKNVMEMYKAVKQRKAFVFKTKIVSPGKGIDHYKLLLVETPVGKVEVKIMKKDHPDWFKHDYDDSSN